MVVARGRQGGWGVTSIAWGLLLGNENILETSGGVWICHTVNVQNSNDLFTLTWLISFHMNSISSFKTPHPGGKECFLRCCVFQEWDQGCLAIGLQTVLMAAGLHFSPKPQYNKKPIPRPVSHWHHFPIRCPWCKIQANLQQENHYAKSKGWRQQRLKTRSPPAHPLPHSFRKEHPASGTHSLRSRQILGGGHGP